jgi:hypothetical protein
VDVHGLGQVGVAGPDVHGDHRLVDEVARVGADDVTAEDFGPPAVSTTNLISSRVLPMARALVTPVQSRPARDHVVTGGPCLWSISPGATMSHRAEVRDAFLRNYHRANR